MDEMLEKENTFKTQRQTNKTMNIMYKRIVELQIHMMRKDAHQDKIVKLPEGYYYKERLLKSQIAPNYI